MEWAGYPLTIPRCQVRALLYRLGTRLQAIPRDHLCLLLWPETSRSNAHRNLSHLLTHLRRALPDPKLLLASDDQVGLDPHRVWSDTTAFERLCAVLTAPPAAGSGWEEQDENLQRAIDLYRGPFLDGFSPPASPEFEAWATLEGRIWECLYLKALAALVEIWTAQGRLDKAIACAQRYLETDDLAEDMHRCLIRLYAATDNRSAALRQFERCAAALERELGVSPLPETRAAYQAVLESWPLQRSTAGPAWATLPGLDVPLVGRDGALRRLEQAYARARAGRGGVVLISGEAGIGKSRLMQDFANHLRTQALVLAGAGQPGAQPPYNPIAQALRAAVVNDLRPWTSELSEVWLAEVSRLLPELRTLHPHLPSPMTVEPDEARARLFEALCRFTLALASGPHPVLLCLDDLHWADGATLEWLAYLGRCLSGNRLLVIGTYRSEEAGAVAELRHPLSRLGILSELRLKGLNADAVLTLLRHLLGSLPGDEAAFARSVIELLQDEGLRKRLGREARRRILEEFAWDKLVANVERAYGLGGEG